VGEGGAVGGGGRKREVGGGGGEWRGAILNYDGRIGKAMQFK